MKKIITSVALTASLFAGNSFVPTAVEPVAVNPTPAPTALASHGVSLKAGTLGFGLDIEHAFNKKHSLRLNANYLEYTRDDEEIKGITYDAKLTLKTLGLLYDYHPWESSTFRLSAGVYYDGNKLTANAKPSTSKIYTIGDRQYQLDTNAELSAKIDFKKVAPYLGLGWSSTEVNGWHFTADIGVMYIGKPKVNYKLSSATGTVTDVETGEQVNVEDDGTLKQNLEKERQEVYDKIKKYKFYPVVMIGIQKRF